MPEVENGEDRVTMKITGQLVDYMIELDPTYRDFVVRENGRRVIYVVILGRSRNHRIAKSYVTESQIRMENRPSVTLRQEI